MKVLLILLIVLPGLVRAETHLRLTMKKMAQALVKTQGQDGRFEGTFEADPGFELLSLVLMKKYGHGDPAIEKAFIKKALNWKTADGFGYYPKGPYSHDTTGLVLVSLRALGYDFKSLGLSEIHQKFINRGGEKKLNLGTKILLAPLGLASSAVIDNFLSVYLMSIPDALPLSQKGLGIFRSLIIPITTWNYYQNQKPWDFENDRRAREGLEWILHHQMPNGTWYTLFHAIVNIAALEAAQKAGVGNYTTQINKALLAIKNWRTKNSRGEITQQLTLTTGWDTPQTLIALSELPANIKSKYADETKKAVQFLDRNQITEPGDWIVNSPHVTPGGWSFIVENGDYPDTDVVAAVLESKLAFPNGSSPATFSRGLHWLLGLQNKDGGFPAWEKGVSKTTDRLLKTIFPELPDYGDLSQADVTSRIARFLHKIKDRHPHLKLDEVIKKSCRFIKKSKENGPYWKGRWLVAYLYGTSESVDTLISTGCSSLREMESSVKWLVDQQNKDGGFGESHEAFVQNQFVRMNSTVMQTSYVVHGLLAYEERYFANYRTFSPYKQSLDKAMAYLIAQAQKDDYMMKERSFTGVIGAKLWYSDYALSPQFMTLRALGRYSKLQ